MHSALPGGNVAVQLTDSVLQALVRSGTPFERADGLVRGLRIRRQTKAGPVVWSLWYRRPNDPGAATRYTLGGYSREGVGGLTLAAARGDARRLRLKIESDKADPQHQLGATRRAEAARRLAPKPASAREVVEKALAKLNLKPSTRKEWARRAKVDLFPAPFIDRPATDIDRDQVERWLARVADRSEHSANSARTVLLACYSWAVTKKVVAFSPVVGVAVPSHDALKKENERDLKPEELRAILLALDEIEMDAPAYRVAYVEATRLLLLTGVRRAAVLGITRSEVDGIGGKEPIWRIPGERSKNGKEHKVPLSAQAVRLIERRFAAVKTAHLFPQYSASGEPLEKGMSWSSHFISDLKSGANRIYEQEMKPWKIHGFRSALATLGREKLKISGDVISMLLSHTPSGPKVSRRYNRAELMEERRAALQAWALMLDSLLSDAVAGEAKVLPFR